MGKPASDVTPYRSEHRAGVVSVLSDLMISARHFDVLSILGFGLDDSLAATLHRHGFRVRTAVRAIGKVLQGELPVLIRPSTATFTADSFILEGLDTRCPSSWALKPIASDAA